MLIPDYILESSWEVCNKVGGIYTVLSTRAKTLQDAMHDRIIFIGPDVWQTNESPYFIEDKALYCEWRRQAQAEGLSVRIGRWDIPGCPIAFLVGFNQYFERKNDIYTWLWEHYRVDSLHAYGDYDESSMFSYAAGLVVESFYKHNLKDADRVVYHGNEWMCGLGLLYVNNKLPQVATVFTTHATSIGRSIAGNMKPLYDYLFAYNGDQMAGELNMQSKHSIEKQTAFYVDCFTTVSDITANECMELMDKPVDMVLPNGFDDSFVPQATSFSRKRKAARKRLLAIANALLGEQLDDDTLIVSTSGRYEFRNKGVDVFIEAASRLLHNGGLKRKVLAFIEVPGWVAEPRKDLQERMKSGKQYDTPLMAPQLTHWLHDMKNDNVLNMLRRYNMCNRKEDMVKVVFIPCYLDGKDGIVNMPYYDVVLGNDLCIYPSYYEPWGYTPLEAIAFSVPCVTTNLAGFGLWANEEIGISANEKGLHGEDKGLADGITNGVKVIGRTDYNYSEVADTINDTVAAFANLSEKEVKKARKNARTLSKKALWSEFIRYYYEAYDIALAKAEARKKQ